MKTKLLLLASTLALSGCKSGPSPVAETPKIPKGARTFPVKQLTTTGRNDRAVYSFDGSSIFYVSAGRTGHTNFQAYQYFFSTQRDRRLTFQDGEIESVIPGFRANEIFYASSTDEIKESPDFIRNATQKNSTVALDFFARPLPRTEIYFSDINGDSIKRLTRSADFDGELSLRRLKNEFVFTSYRGGNLDIYAMINGNAQRVTSSKEADFSPAIAEKGDLAFVRGVPAVPTPTPGMVTPPLISQIYVADSISAKARALTTEPAVHLHPAWHPKEPWIVFSMNYPDPRNYELYWIRKDGKCLERLTYSAENEFSPAFSPDGTQMIFTREMGDERHLFIMSEITQPVCVDEVAPTPPAS